MRKNKCLSTICEYKSHVAEESGPRAMVGEWLGKSPNTTWENDESPRITVVGIVPEHKGSQDSPRARGRSRQSRAREWSEQSPSTMVVGTVPEHKDSRDSPRARGWSGQSPSTKSVAINHMPLVLLCYVFIYLFVLISLV